jgi:hypothetical protein
MPAWDSASCGPRNRYGALVIVEKDGIAEILVEVGVGALHDVAIASRLPASRAPPTAQSASQKETDHERSCRPRPNDARRPRMDHRLAAARNALVTGARRTVHYLVCDRHNRELREARRYLRWTAPKP